MEGAQEAAALGRGAHSASERRSRRQVRQGRQLPLAATDGIAHLDGITAAGAEQAELAGAGQDGRIGPLHLLIGILRADVGTVPRALELAGIDRTDLVARAEQAA